MKKIITTTTELTEKETKLVKTCLYFINHRLEKHKGKGIDCVLSLEQKGMVKSLITLL